MKNFLSVMRPTGPPPPREIVYLAPTPKPSLVIIDPFPGRVYAKSLVVPTRISGVAPTASTTRFDMKKHLKEYFGEEKVSIPMKAGSIYMRASHLYKLCPREELMVHMQGKIRTETVSWTTGAVFGYGHLAHHWMQNKIFQKILQGCWKCDDCGRVHGDKLSLIHHPGTCKGCGSNRLTYEELYYYEDQLHFGGHPDGFVFDAGEMQLIDFKTARMEGYDGVERWGISAGYVWQANAYMYMTGLSVLRMIYMNKNEPAWKEKIIRRDEAIIDQIKVRCLDTIYAVESSVKSTTQVFLPQRTCPDKSEKRAKDCSMCGLCFKLQEQEGFVDKTTVI